jgi:hypothetical protein
MIPVGIISLTKFTEIVNLFNKYFQRIPCSLIKKDPDGKKNMNGNFYFKYIADSLPRERTKWDNYQLYRVKHQTIFVGIVDSVNEYISCLTSFIENKNSCSGSVICVLYCFVYENVFDEISNILEKQTKNKNKDDKECSPVQLIPYNPLYIFSCLNENIFSSISNSNNLKENKEKIKNDSNKKILVSSPFLEIVSNVHSSLDIDLLPSNPLSFLSFLFLHNHLPVLTSLYLSLHGWSYFSFGKDNDVMNIPSDNLVSRHDIYFSSVWKGLN